MKLAHLIAIWMSFIIRLHGFAPELNVIFKCEKGDFSGKFSGKMLPGATGIYIYIEC